MEGALPVATALDKRIAFVREEFDLPAERDQPLLVLAAVVVRSTAAFLVQGSGDEGPLRVGMSRLIGAC